MFIYKNFLLAILDVALVVLPLLVHAQDQLGFISIDCGLSDVISYTDKTSAISYVSDANFTEFGENKAVSQTYKAQTDERQFWNVRSFLTGDKNCYTLRPSRAKGTRYLIRARFMYGNYDNKNQPPIFDLYLGVDLWDTVRINNAFNTTTKGIIHTASSDRIHVCLVNIGYGTPFISVLELRPLGKDIYTTKTESSSLKLVNHYDFSSSTNKVKRYKDDPYDRLWEPLYTDIWTPSLSNANGEIIKDDYEIPSSVMSTAYTRNISDNYLEVYEENLNKSSIHYLYMYFTELEVLKANQTREFNIYVNKQLWYGPFSPKYLQTDTIYSTRGLTPDNDGAFDIFLNNTKSATLPPLINAAELYEMVDLLGQFTNQTEVEALLAVKSFYGLKRIKWQGDPCAPESYMWNGLNCSYTDRNPSRIISLNLSSSGLQGNIASSIANLSMLKYLDLSYNNLTGPVPDYLAHFPILKVLNLSGNNFTGPVPEALLSKKDLQFSIGNNQDTNVTCSSRPCGKKKGFVIPLVASLGGLIVVVFIIAALICFRKRRKLKADDVRVETTSTVMPPYKDDDPLGSEKQQQFTYSEILKITNNFQRVLGEGGFGKVYHGVLNGNEVAVKILSAQSLQGHREFQAELKLLLRVHHKNLTTLVGYCNDGTNVGLIYEYMAMGNLRSHINGSLRSFLSWEDRIRIAIDTAQGLEYLHNGCRPPIVHRDVKSTNILLTEKFQAKLSDFGLSKIFPVDGDDHKKATSSQGITTSIAGTPGYLDPEYYVMNLLNEKSDVYSFGVVLLELITARPVLTKIRENHHIIQWVSSVLPTGDITSIIDTKIGRDCDINSVWKSIEIAMACVSKTSNNRPIMSHVTIELKECLRLELIRRDNHEVTDLSNDSSVYMMSRDTISEFSPVAR